MTTRTLSTKLANAEFFWNVLAISTGLKKKHHENPQNWLSFISQNVDQKSEIHPNNVSQASACDGNLYSICHNYQKALPNTIHLN